MYDQVCIMGAIVGAKEWAYLVAFNTSGHEHSPRVIKARLPGHILNGGSPGSHPGRGAGRSAAVTVTGYGGLSLH